MSFDPYITLGLDRNASAEEITAAYRRCAAAAHPDREGGSTERMTDVNMACKILGDSESKARYDRGEGTQAGPTIEERARDTLLQVLNIAIREIPLNADLIDLMRAGVNKQIGGLAAARVKTAGDLDRLKRLRKRLKGPPENPFHGLIDNEIKRGESFLPKFDADEAMLERCLEILEDYSCEPESMSDLLRPGGVVLLPGAFF